MAEENLGGPGTEVDRESDTVAAIATQDQSVRAVGMGREDGPQRRGNENWTAPAMSHLDSAESGMQTANALFETGKQLGGLSVGDLYR